eukprot:750409-Prorocentrum_minimum.AAC.1
MPVCHAAVRGGRLNSAGHRSASWSPLSLMVTTQPHGHHSASWSPVSLMVTTQPHGHHSAS